MYRRYRVPVYPYVCCSKSFRCWWNPYFVRLETAQHQSNPIDHLWYRVVTGLSPHFHGLLFYTPVVILETQSSELLFFSSHHFYTFNPFCDQWNPMNVGSVPLILCYLDPIPHFRSMFFHVFPVASVPIFYSANHDVQGAMAATAPADRVKSSPVSRTGSPGETAKQLGG